MRADLRTVEVNQVVDELIAATRQKRIAAARNCFLEDAQNPSAGLDERVVCDERIDRAHKGNGRLRTAKQIRNNPDVLCLEIRCVRGEGRAKESKTRRASDVDRPRSAVGESV